jgi:hypothetical protein
MEEDSLYFLTQEGIKVNGEMANRTVKVNYFKTIF